MWQVDGLYGVNFQPPRLGLEPSHSTPKPIIQPLRLNPQFPFSCSLLSTTLHNAYPPYLRSFDISIFIASVNNSKRFEWYCWILSKIFWLKFVLSKYFQEFLILSIHACLILLRGSIDPSNPKAILESPNIKPAKEAEANMTGRLVANSIFSRPYTSIISLLLFPPSHVWWFSGWHDSHPPSPGPMVHRLPTLVNLAPRCFVAHI